MRNREHNGKQKEKEMGELRKQRMTTERDVNREGKPKEVTLKMIGTMRRAEEGSSGELVQKYKERKWKVRITVTWECLRKTGGSVPASCSAWMCPRYALLHV